MNGLIVKANSILRPLTVLDLQERRLFAFCLQHYDSRQDANNPLYFRVPITKFKEAYPEYQQYKPGQIFKVCETAMDGIQGKGYRPDPAKKDKIYWFQRLKVDDGEILFGLTPEAMPYFLNLKSHFISYHLADVRLMSKPSAWNLYEYIKEHFQNGQIPDWQTTVEDLKDRLGVGDKYKGRLNNFEKKCLINPLADINNYTDLHADYYKIKKGVRVVKIKFEVYYKCSDPETLDTEDQNKTLKRELQKAGVSKAAVARFTKTALDQGKTAEILTLIPKAKKAHKKHGKKSWAAYLSGILYRELQPHLPGIDKELKSYVREGDRVSFSGREFTVDQNGISYNGATIAIGQLTELLQHKQLKIVEASPPA